MRTLLPAASQSKWTSHVYEHYNVTLERIREGETKEIKYVFGCKFQHKSHDSLDRLRMKTSSGTTNLRKAASKCDLARGVVTQGQLSAELSSGAIPYTSAAHRVLIAMKSAVSHRPFNAVHDTFYQMEVEMLRPGTTLPHRTTISRDIKHLYSELSTVVLKYFKVCPSGSSLDHLI